MPKLALITIQGMLRSSEAGTPGAFHPDTARHLQELEQEGYQPILLAFSPAEQLAAETWLADHTLTNRYPITLSLPGEERPLERPASLDQEDDTEAEETWEVLSAFPLMRAPWLAEFIEPLMAKMGANALLYADPSTTRCATVMDLLNTHDWHIRVLSLTLYILGG